MALPAYAASFTDNGNGTVTDPATGLTWMRCAMGQTWTGSTCSGTASTYTWDQANALTGAVSFAGQIDWRLPTIRELQTIVDFSRNDPVIDSSIFPTKPTSGFWSGSPDADYPEYAWFVNFNYGYVNRDYRSNHGSVRLVRGGQAFGSLLNLARPLADYVDHGNGTATHTPSGLMWQRCAMGQTWTGSTCSGGTSKYTWDAAAALTDSFAGYTDWRLPTVKELLTLVDYTTLDPSINSNIFPATSSSFFWSGSPYAPNSDGAWGVGFSYGYANWGYRSYNFSVRFVRDGQSLGTLALTVNTTGNGSVSSAPAGIACGSTCNASFANGVSVTLTATPAAGYTFSGWSGACTGTSNPCTVSMTAAQNVTAMFTANATVPGTPSNVTVTAGIAEATVSFSVPANDGGSPIAGYTVTANPGGIAASGSSSPITVTGLTPGVSYTFTVTASNTVGASSASSAPFPVAPLPAILLTASPGWNLLGNGTSTPLEVASVFGDANKVITVWKWNPARSRWAFYAPAQSDGGAAYSYRQGYDFLTTISSGEGFWINAKQAFTVSLSSGSLIASTSFQDSPDPSWNKLAAGWNLIAIGDDQTPGAFNQALATGATSGGLTSLWAWDAGKRGWYFYAPTLETSGSLSSYNEGKGFLDFGARTLGPSMGFWVNKPAPAASDATGQGTKTIDSTGGTVPVISSDAVIGKAKVEIPAGALTTSKAISIANASACPTSSLSPSSCFEIGPSGTVFQTPIKVTLPYDHASMFALNSLVPMSYDQAAGKWQELEIDSVDAANKTVTAVATHLSPFGTYSRTYGDDFVDTRLLTDPQDNGLVAGVSLKKPLDILPGAYTWVLYAWMTYGSALDNLKINYGLYPKFVYQIELYKNTKDLLGRNRYEQLSVVRAAIGAYEAQVDQDMYKFSVRDGDNHELRSGDWIYRKDFQAWFQNKYFLWKFKCNGAPCQADPKATYNIKVLFVQAGTEACADKLLSGGTCGANTLSRTSLMGPTFQDNKYAVQPFTAPFAKANISEANGILCDTQYLSKVTACNKVTVVNGACGVAKGTTVATVPTSNLCSAGTPVPTTPAGSGPWTWSCNSTTGGTDDTTCIAYKTSSCTYTYNAWNSCANGTQSRTVATALPAGCTGTPSLSQTCTPPACTYTYNAWGSCANGTQSRTVATSLPAGCTGTPSLSQTCTPPACTYTYNGWGSCVNGTQSRTVATSLPTGCTGTPSLSQTCTPPVCTYTYNGWGSCVNGTQSRTVATSLPTGCTGTPSLSQTCSVTPPVTGARPLNDTGITFCGDASTNTASCATVGADNGAYPRQDARYGRDARAAAGTLAKVGGGEAGFDFTALNASGQATTPSSGATPHSCVRDNVTGLIWEVKTADGGLRDQGWTYTWYDSAHNYGGNPGTASGGNCRTSGRCDTEKYVADVNATRLCGYSDWRMPTVKELEGIVHYGRTNPSIDPTYFPNTPSSHFWSGSPGADVSYDAWYVYFGYGYASNNGRSDNGSVRLVRGGQ